MVFGAIGTYLVAIAIRQSPGIVESSRPRQQPTAEQKDHAILVGKLILKDGVFDCLATSLIFEQVGRVSHGGTGAHRGGDHCGFSQHRFGCTGLHGRPAM